MLAGCCDGGIHSSTGFADVSNSRCRNRSLLRHRETISRLSRLCCGSGSSGENRVWASTAQPRQVLANNGVPNALVGSAALPVGMAKIKTGLTGDMTTLAVPEPIASLPKFYTSTMPAIHSIPRDPGVPYRGPPYGNPGNCLPHRAPLRPFRVRRAGLPMAEVCLVDHFAVGPMSDIGGLPQPPSATASCLAHDVAIPHVE